jgi:hypothetical protein
MAKPNASFSPDSSIIPPPNAILYNRQSTGLEKYLPEAK